MHALFIRIYNTTVQWAIIYYWPHYRFKYLKNRNNEMTEKKLILQKLTIKIVHNLYVNAIVASLVLQQMHLLELVNFVGWNEAFIQNY